MNLDGITMSYDIGTGWLQIKYPTFDLLKESKFFEVELEDIRGKTSDYKFKVDYIEQDLSFLDQNMLKNDLINSKHSITAKIKSIDYFGKMVIEFSQLMRTEIVNITHLNQSFFDIYLNPSNNWHKYEEDFNLSKLNFTWNVTAYERD
jgi:hypothetical protein